MGLGEVVGFFAFPVVGAAIAAGVAYQTECFSSYVALSALGGGIAGLLGYAARECNRCDDEESKAFELRKMQGFV